MLLIAFNFIMINAKTLEEILAEIDLAKAQVDKQTAGLSITRIPMPKESWSTIGSIGAVGLVGAWSSYLLHKSKQYQKQKFEDARYQLQIRGIVFREEKNFFADIVRAYGKIRHPETASYLKQLKELHEAIHTRENLFQSALVITLTTGISALVMIKEKLLH